MNSAVDFGRSARPAGKFELREILQIEPEFGIALEVAGQAKSSVCGDTTALANNFADAGGGDVKGEGQTGCGQTERPHKIVSAELAWEDGRDAHVGVCA